MRRLEGTPSVSIVLPTLNERPHLRDCLDSLASQDYPAIKEILVVDGGSKDGTRDLVAREGGLVRLLDNPRVTAAAAMNIGVAQASGEIVVRADAHSLYAKDYVRRCVEVLVETGAENVGGLMRPVGTTSFGRAVAAATSSPIGVGPGKFHYSDRREEVDTVYLGTWRRDTLQDLGGYDEESLQWAAEDQELNFRIRQRGGTIVLDPGIRSWYFPRETPKALWRQYENYGVAKASTLAKHRRLPTLRPLAPAALVAAAAAALVTRRPTVMVAIPLAHLTVCSRAAWKMASDPGVAPHRALAAIEICHWSYGVGFWRGICRLVLGRGFDTSPQGHR